MNAIDLTWAGGEHAFALPIGHLRALQNRCDAGPGFVLNRLKSGVWHVDDVVQTIRLGLEGGGLDKDKARELVQVHVEDDHLARHVLVAVVILQHAVYGPEDDQPEKPGAGETPDKSFPAADGGFPDSTAPAP